MSTAVDHPITTSILSAISAGPDVQDWLVNTHAPRILHIFERACNLANERGEVISLVSREVGNGPFNLVFPPQSLEANFNKIKPSTPIALYWLGLKIGDEFIDAHQAVPWNARPDWSALSKNRSIIIYNLRFYMKWLLTQAHPDSLLSLFFHTVHYPSARFEKYAKLQNILSLKSQEFILISRMMAGLCEAVHAFDLDTCHFTAQRLAGLGLGLTPSGDDFLLGVIYATWIIHPRENAELITSSIASAAIPRTNSLSSAWIQAAARGLVSEIWLDLLNTINLEKDISIKSALHRLLSIGHTSGADALAGFIGCLTQAMAYPALKLIPANQNEHELKDSGFAVLLWD